MRTDVSRRTKTKTKIKIRADNQNMTIFFFQSLKNKIMIRQRLLTLRNDVPRLAHALRLAPQEKIRLVLRTP
jgi:hypothetical protein